MSLKKSVQDIFEKFEQSMPAKQMQQIEKVHMYFEKMVEIGVFQRSSYNLETIGNLPATLLLQPTQFKK